MPPSSSFNLNLLLRPLFLKKWEIVLLLLLLHNASKGGKRIEREPTQHALMLSFPPSPPPPIFPPPLPTDRHPLLNSYLPPFPFSSTSHISRIPTRLTTHKSHPAPPPVPPKIYAPPSPFNFDIREEGRRWMGISNFLASGERGKCGMSSRNSYAS